MKVAKEVLWQLDSLQNFLKELRWPDEVFSCHITHRMKMLSSDMIQSVVARYSVALRWSFYSEVNVRASVN